jgi:hypothetical protein
LDRHEQGSASSRSKQPKNWDKAYYDDDTLKDLGLLPDNNQKLEEEQKQEQQQKDATSLR